MNRSVNDRNSGGPSKKKELLYRRGDFDFKAPVERTFEAKQTCYFLVHGGGGDGDGGGGGGSISDRYHPLRLVPAGF